MVEKFECIMDRHLLCEYYHCEYYILLLLNKFLWNDKEYWQFECIYRNLESKSRNLQTEFYLLSKEWETNFY